LGTTVHDAVVAAAVDSTTVDSDNSGEVSGPVVPETKGNDDDADAMVDDKNKRSVDDGSEKGRSCKVIVGGGVVVGQVMKGNNDDVVVRRRCCLSLPHDPPTEEKGDEDENNNTPVEMMSNMTRRMTILTK
jgi:hypothetical protein